VVVGAEGNGTISMVNPANPPVRIKSTEKTMIEIRALFLRFHKPTAVTMPQIAGSKYTREAAAISALKAVGEPGNGCVWLFGTNTITTKTRRPIASARREPSSDRIEIAVTPAERIIGGALSVSLFDLLASTLLPNEYKYQRFRQSPQSSGIFR
jgi:hypothetical protein